MSSIRSRITRRILQRLKGSRYWDLQAAAMRESMDQATRLLPVPASTQILPVSEHAVKGEWLIPPQPEPGKALLYFHGGGYVIGSPQSHRPLVSRIAHYSRVRALSINYRMAPEHTFPAALEDALAAYRWLQQQGFSSRDIIFGGDSAGGNLVLVSLLALRQAGEALPAAGVCLSPLTDWAGTGESYRTRAEIDPLLSSKAGRLLEIYAPHMDPHNPLLSPLYADLSGFPPLLVQVGSDEILYDDAAGIVAHARQAGVDARLEVYPGMWHVFQAFSPLVPEADPAIRKIADYIRQVFQLPDLA